MAPWPEQGNEPKAPDKSCNKSGENSSVDAAKVNLGATEDTEVNAATSRCDDKQTEGRNAHVSNLDDGQLRALLDEAIAYKCPKDREGKSNLFRELLQEAEADETECGDSRRIGVGSHRYYSNSNRRRGRRDAQVSERQTRGGSLQNLVHASNSEFDPAAGFGGYHSGGGRSSRKSKRSSTGSSYGSGSVGGSGSVSARQREGGSLPSNVNVGGMLTLTGLDYNSTLTSLPFDDIKSCKQAAAKRKELIHSASSNEFTSMPVQASSINSSGSGSGVESGIAVTTNCVAQKAEFMVLDLRDLDVGDTGRERRGSTGGSVRVTNISTSANSATVDSGRTSAHGDIKCAVDANGTEEEGVELEVLQRSELTARVQNYTSRATLEVGHGESKKPSQSSSLMMDAGAEVDATVAFLQCTEKTISMPAVNGLDQNSLQLRSSYNSVKSIMNSTSLTSGVREDKSIISKGSEIPKHSAGSEAVGKAAAVSPASTASAVHSMYPMQHVSVLSLPASSWSIPPVSSEKHDNYRELTTWYTDLTVKRPTREDVNRLTFHGSAKDSSGELKNKSLDENGNALNRLESSLSNSTERKGKQRKTKTNNDRNVIMSQNIEGHRGDKDIDTLLKFIESNSDTKGTNKTKNAASHSNGPMNFSSKQQRNCSRLIGGGTKPRRDRGCEEPAVEEDRVGKGRTGAGKQVIKEHRGKGSKLKKSNSLEEISKTKLEDLTSNSKYSEGGAGSPSGSCHNGGEDSSSVLVRRPKKQQTLDNGEFYGEKTRVGDRRSWGTEEGQQYYCTEGGVTVSADESSGGSAQSSRKKRGNQGTNNISSDDKRRSDREEGVSVTSLSATSGASEDTEFHLVTKKQRRKKRRSSSGGRGTSASTGGSIFGDDNWRPPYNNYNPSYYSNRDNGNSYYQKKTFSNTGGGFPPHDRTVEREGGMWCDPYRHRQRSPDHLRRKSTSSMPPSDKSDSSDLDSVHSLPVSSTTAKLALDQTSTSSGSTPQASYADIARMASTYVVPSNPAHSNNYVNINLNSGKWPAMGTPKSCIAVTTSTTSVAVAVTTSSPNTPSATSVVTSNPQFITGPKLNIGAPPVSGSKVSAVSPNPPLPGQAHASPAAAPATAPAPPPPPPPPPPSDVVEETSQSSTRKDSETLHLPSEPISTSKTHASQSPPSDVRTKKDAMTSTSLDYSTVSQSSSEENNLKPYQQCVSPKPTEAPVNLLLDGEYPSLEESLVDKSKNLKSSHVHTAPVDSVNSSSGLVANNPSKERNSLNHPALQSASDQEKIIPAAAACAKLETQTLQEPCVPESVPARTGGGPKVDAEASKPKVLTGKEKAFLKKKIGPGINPPVVMMNDKGPEALGDGVTFGFEVNEQLLMCESPEKADRPSVVPQLSEEVTGTHTSAIEDAKSAPSSSPSSPPVAAYSSAGEDFSARYRDPPIQPDNHDKIVTYVGLAWDDVLKEMNCLPVHSSGKVQYYSGQ